MAIDIQGQSNGNGKVFSTHSERPEANVARDEGTVEEKETGSSSTADTVSLSNSSAQLRSLENTLAELPVVDTKRVESIKQSIADGSFRINAESVADKLINLEQSLAS